MSRDINKNIGKIMQIIIVRKKLNMKKIKIISIKLKNNNNKKIKIKKAQK